MESELPPDQPAPADVPPPAGPPADAAGPAGPPPNAADPADLRAGAAEEPPAGGDGPDAPPPPTPPPPGLPGGWAPPFQFLRSRHERKLGGVAGGLAAATGLDPTLVRFAVVLGCLTGWGILGYLIAWVVIPEEDPVAGRFLLAAPERTARHIRIGLAVFAGLGVLHVVGAILGIISSALIGLGLFPARLFGLSHRGFMPGEALLGLLLVVGGLLLLFRRHLPWAPAPDTGTGPAWFSGGFAGGPSTGAGWAPPAGPPGAAGGPAAWPGTAGVAGGPAPAPAAVGAPGAPGTAETAGAPGAAATAGAPGAAGTAEAPGAAGTAGAPGVPGTAGAPGSAGRGPDGPRAAAASAAARASAAATAAARMARTNGPLLIVRAVGWLVGLWFLAAAVVGTGFWITGALHVHLPLLPIVTGAAALGLLGWTLTRSRRVAAVVGAMALLLVPAALAAALGRVDGQAGHRSVTPVVMADLDRSYRHAAGLFELDLSRLQLPAGETPVHISMGAGKIDVTVPWDADVRATASVGAGTFELFGSRQTGVNLNGRAHSDGPPGGPVLVISARAGAGAIEIHRGSEPFTHEALRTGQPVPMQCDLSAAQTSVNGVIAGGPIRCSAADGVTVTPALNCVVAGSGAALCRPVGEPEPAVGFAREAGTRHCQVPAGGGDSTCTGPVPPDGSAPAGGSFTCSIPEGGGPSDCHPSGGGASAGPTAPTTPASPTNPAAPTTPASPTAPSSPPNTAAPGEYRCTVPEGGGPATCQPA